MCYMVYHPAHVQPDGEKLINGGALNPHGYGWTLGTDEVYHGMSLPIAVGSFVQARRGRWEVPAIFHARYATGNSPRTLANCQPLILEDGTVLAHNGGLFPVIDGEPESDTRIFAEEFLPRWDLDSETDRAQLERLIGSNKMIILRPGKPDVFLNSHLGIWLPDGSWHSNSDYTGSSHLRAGQCSACGIPVPSVEAATLCPRCQADFEQRYVRLREAR